MKVAGKQDSGSVSEFHIAEVEPYLLSDNTFATVTSQSVKLLLVDDKGAVMR